ncbi:MAG: RICIN domain-containing protein [Pseudonocardiales bacterium]
MTSETQSVQTFRNENTGWCLDDSVEFGLRTYGCNYGRHQQWNVRAWADGTRQLRNVATGGCILDTRSIGIGIARCDSTRSQSWYVGEVPDGGIRFINESPNYCLGDDRGRLVSWSCIGGYYPAETIWH